MELIKYIKTKYRKHETKNNSYTLEPAFLFKTSLTKLFEQAGTNPANEWYFYDGAFSSRELLEGGELNSWKNENFVVIVEGRIIAYFEGHWSRPTDIISNIGMILFDKTRFTECWKAFYDYLDYIFVSRGCYALNWYVAEQNTHAYKLYEFFIKHSCGHRVGKKHHAMKSYTGKISDIILYEMTKEEYFAWKEKKKFESE